MISIDTNVLLRYLLQDDQDQSPKANRLFGGKKKIADFADALIFEKSKSICGEKGESFDGLFTFDISAQQFNGSKVPE